MTALPSHLPMHAPRRGLTLAVLDGLHRGVALPIAGESCTIGSASGCDVVLADPRIAPDHLRLRFYGRQVAVDALGGDVDIEGHAVVQRGHGRRMALPVVLRLGEARLRIGRTAAPAVIGGRMTVGVVAAFVAVLVALLATQSSGFSIPNARIDPVRAPTQAPAPVQDALSPVDELRAKIAEAGLDGLTVEGSGHHLSVAGNIAEGQGPAWTDVQRWFDGRFGGREVLSARVATEPPAAPPEFALQAVWFGENPYVVDARGDRRYPGASLQGGWVLKSIDRDRITVSRNGRDFQLNL